MNLSDSQIARGAALNGGEKGGLKPKTIQWILIALVITVLFCVVTIFVLFSKLSTVRNNHLDLEDSVSSLDKQFKTNNYLNPVYSYNSWQKSYSLTPQTFDSSTNYTDMYDTSTANYFTWSTQSGGYGTCELWILVKDCNRCQFAVTGSLNKGALYPTKNFTTSWTSTSLTYTFHFNFVLAQGSNTFDASFALIGDSSQGSTSVSTSNSVECYVFGAQS